MNQKQFQYVLTLARHGSFAKAADALGISQPSLSQYVRKIEQQLGVILFDRTGGSVRLTDAGQVYMETGRTVLDLEHRMMGRFNDLAEHKCGTLVVGTSPYRSSAMMPTVAARFREHYPGMHLVVEEMTSRELIEAAEHGQFDLCLTMLPIPEQLFSSEEITEEELILAVPRGFPALTATEAAGRKYPAVDAVSLDGAPFVMITEGQWMQQALDNLAADLGLHLTPAVVVKSLEAQIAMVRAGMGMALLPSGIEGFCSPDEVTFYSLRQSLPRRKVVVIWPRERELNGVTRELLDIIRSIPW